MDFAKILSALGGGNLGDVEGKAGDLLTRLEKLGADVIGSNGNLVETIVSLASDFATMKQAVSDVLAIVDDLKGLHASMSDTHAQLQATLAVAKSAPVVGIATAAPAVAPVPSPAPAPVSVMSILNAAENVANVVAPVLAKVASDPFAPKPLSRIAAVVEPRGGA